LHTKLPFGNGVTLILGREQRDYTGEGIFLAAAAKL